MSKTWFVASILGFKKWFDVDVLGIKISCHFCHGGSFGYFLKIGLFSPESSGHTGGVPTNLGVDPEDRFVADSCPSVVEGQSWCQVLKPFCLCPLQCWIIS